MGFGSRDWDLGSRISVTAPNRETPRPEAPSSVNGETGPPVTHVWWRAERPYQHVRLTGPVPVPTVSSRTGRFPNGIFGPFVASVLPGSHTTDVCV